MHQPNFEAAKQYIFTKLENGLPEDLIYHGMHHTCDDVLPAAERLAARAQVQGEALLLLRTGALYHDVGYLEQYANNEPVGARIAEETLPDFGYNQSQIDVIKAIILATQMPQAPHTLLEALMCDADLDSLGREDFLETSLNLRAELAMHGLSIPLQAWYEKQLEFLTSHQYFTEAACALRNAGKERNIALLERLLNR